MDFSLIDGFTKVTDKDAAVYTRKLAIEEGIFVGNSSGSAIKGLLQLKNEFKPDDVVVIMFHDHGSRYVGKMFNDDWMRENSFLDIEIKTAADAIQNRINDPLIFGRTEELISHAIERMKKFNLSHIPIIDNTGFVGSLSESKIFNEFVKDKSIANKLIKSLMDKPFPIVKHNTPIEEISKLLDEQNNAVLVELETGKFQTLTQQDIVRLIN